MLQRRRGRGERPATGDRSADQGTPPPSPTTLPDYTHSYTDAQYESAFDAWRWLDLEGKTPLFVSLFGHAFLSATDGIWVLDPIDGTLERRWDDEAALRAELDTEAGQDEWLLAGLAIAAERRRIPRDEGQIYNFVPPPILGGAFDLDRVMVMDFEVSLHVAGQLHDQIRDLPPGSRISGFKFDEFS